MAGESQWRMIETAVIANHRWRRIIPSFAFLFIIILFLFYADSVRDFHSLRKTSGTFKNRRNGNTGPLHVLLISYARSGSSFVGDMLQSLPSTFYHFEPVHYISSPVLKGNYTEARELLRLLYHCNVNKISDYLQWVKDHKIFLKLQRNERYWKACSKVKGCHNSTYMDSYCRNHSIVIVKTIRMSLKESAKLFDLDPDLNLKMIYLIRDLRGTINSRMKFPIYIWCKKDPVCSDRKYFCSILEEDMGSICSLLEDRPDDFMALRYEDVATDPFGVATRLAQFLGFSTTPPEMEVFLKTHISVTGNVKDKLGVSGLQYSYTTIRNSSLTAFNWRKEMKFELVSQIQTECQSLLTTMGYHWYSTLASLRSNVDFNLGMDVALREECSLK